MLHRRDMGRKPSTFKNKVKTTQLNKCAKTGKISYPNEKQANRDKMKIWSSNTSMTIEEFSDLHVYDCEHCKMKHIGHRSYFDVEAV